MNFLEFLIVIGFLLAALAPYMPVAVWPLELLSHFQLQYFIFGFALLMLARDSKLAVIVLAALILCGAALLPYLKTVPAVSEDGGGKKLKIIQINVFKFNRQYKTLIDYIRQENPDLVVAAEVTPEWAAAFSALKDILPQSFELAGEGSHGMAIYARHALEKKDTLYPDDWKIPALSFDVVRDEGRVSFLSLHPATPVFPEGFVRRDRHFDLAVRWALERKEAAAVVLGDFNVTPFSPSFKELVTKSGLRDARRGRGFLGSWPASFPVFLRIPIDLFLASDGVQVLSMTIGPDVGSDHRPVVTVIGF